MSDGRKEVNEWLESDSGAGMMTIAAALLGIGMVVMVAMTLEGVWRWVFVGVVVLAVIAAIWYLFFSTPKE